MPLLGEVDVVAVEMMIFEFVRPHVVLIEGCLRKEFKRLALHRPLPLRVRECIGRVALALCERLYANQYCLFPEAAARACLLNACARLEIDVSAAELPVEFTSPLVTQINDALSSPENG